MRPVSDRHRLVPHVGHLVRKAATAVLKIYDEKDFNVITKDDDSPLTSADLASHRILSEGLRELTPDLPLLSEESASQTTPAERRSWQRYWLVDPLDGTKEFLKRNGEFTVNVALIEFGRPVLGIVHVPVTGTSYWGVAGERGGRRESDGSLHQLRVAGAVNGRAVRVVGSRSHGGGELETFASALGEHEFLAVGSSLKFCLIADGQADVYLRLNPTCEWDTAAGQAVLEAAGGSVTDLGGQPLRYNARESLINPGFLATGDLSRDYVAAAAPLRPMS